MSTNTGSMQTQLFQLYQNLGGVVLPDQNSNSYSTQGWLSQINLSLEEGYLTSNTIGIVFDGGDSTVSFFPITLNLGGAV